MTMPALAPETPHASDVDLSRLGSPRFVVTVDTEEEFDWTGPFTRDRHGLTHISAIDRFQRLCDENNVKPSYLVDYPIATDKAAVELLGGYAAAGCAEIGVQLHPWVSPPFNEEVSTYNSFACNLPVELEREKLSGLHRAIVSNLGVHPDSYRAGRYGAGPTTPVILQELGIAIDTSVRARFDYSTQSGPDYTRHPLTPYWLVEGAVLELPVTTMFGGALRKAGDMLFRHIFSSDTARAVLSRSAMLERIALTPEGIPLDKALQAIDLALENDLPVLNFSFHSPSLAVGHTPYVRSEEELVQFYHWWEEVFAHLARSGVRPVTMAEIKSAALSE